jgi:hypothetical protein
MAERSLAPKDLLAEFAADDLTACVWKGSTHLAESLGGEGDLDLLVGADDLAAAEDVLMRSGYLRADRACSLDQPGLHDWFGMHGGRLVQVQLYHEIVIGDLARGWWRVPVEKQVLAGCRPSPDGPLVPSPDVDALLHLIRAAMTRRRRDELLRLPWHRAKGRWDAEFAVLAARTSSTELASLAVDWFGSDVGAAVRGVEPSLTLQWLSGMRSVLMRRLSPHPASGTLPRRLRRVLALAIHRADRRRGRGVSVVKRAVPGRGVWILVTGGRREEIIDGVRAVFDKFDSHRPGLDDATPEWARQVRIRRARRARAHGRLVLCAAGSGGEGHADAGAEADLVICSDGRLDLEVTSAAERIWSYLTRRHLE